MPAQYIITGTIIPGENISQLGLKIYAFDRDLPSLERLRESSPPLLGEAVTDAEGRFQITYRLEQFHTGEADIPAIRRMREKNADLSFRIIDRTGQELRIKTIEALNRTFDADAIIFNAPPELEVNLYLAPQEIPGNSEYEQLLSLVAPVIEDLPLSDLTDNDIAFLISELSLEEQQEQQVRLEWLRRSTLLTHQTNLPSEAFYGWGRKDVPIPFPELSEIPLKDLPSVLDRLLGLEEDELRQALVKAVAENIIPANFRERIDDIVRQLKQRNQVLREIVGQLLDAETGQVLAGYTVTTFEVTNEKENLGLDITDNNGKFLFSFYVPDNLATGAPARQFLFQVSTPEGIEFPESEPQQIIPGQPETEVVLVKVAVSTQQSPSLETLLEDGQYEIPEELRELLTHLVDHEIKSFADIRHRGGLSQITDLPQVDSAVTRMLETLIDLDRISPDAGVNIALSHKYDNVLAIADTPVTEFIDVVSNGSIGLTKPKATELHIMARAQTDVLNNMLAGMGANQANGFKILEAAGNVPVQLFPQKCGCSDCEAAVSPAAYLAALLDYTLKHVRNGGNKIDIPFLEATFHQPFGQLPTDCQAVKKAVRQVRICIEALRSYLGNRPLADTTKEAALAKAEADYRFSAYSLLLSKLGTTYEEIRRTRSETSENRKALAERLGIQLTEPRPADPPGDELDRLFLDPAVVVTQPHALTEQVLEELFGLANTVRDPLSEGAKYGDDQSQFTRWNLEDVQWGMNTDPDGKIYVDLAKNTVTGVVRIELYKDMGRTSLVAAGEIPADTGTVKLVAENNSGLSGIVEIAWTADSTDISIAAIPAVLSWQLQFLRTIWTKQDAPEDPYLEGTSQVTLNALPAGLVFPPALASKISYDANSQVLSFEGAMQLTERTDLINLSTDNDYRNAINQLYRHSQRLPIIDPDIIGPDDFRSPVKKEAGQPDKAFDLWLARRQWIDTTLQNLKTGRENNDLSFILKQVLGNPLPDLDALQLTLTGGTAAEIDTVKNRIKDWGLTVESFSRLMEIRTKEQLATVDARNEKVSDIEWNEVYAILTQAQKVQKYAEWRAKEQAAGVRLGMEEFWISLQEPKEGAWPPVPVAGQPLIDPDLVKLTDLPEWKTGKKAVDLWKLRKAKLQQIPNNLKTELETNDFDTMLRWALGHPNPGNPLQHDLNTLKNNLGSTDETVRNKAIQQIENDLHLTVEQFARLVAIKAKDAQPSPANKPTMSEYTEVFTMLRTARKIKHEYPVWITEEQTAGIIFWTALKARLPHWRTTAEARQLWHQTLRNRSGQPVIDPDVIGVDDLRHLSAGDPTFDTWKKRFDDLAAWRKNLKDTRVAEMDELKGLNTIIHDALGIEAAGLEVIDKDREAGQSIEKQLNQLQLTNGAFTFLIRIRKLAKTNQPVVASEWDTVYNTLALAIKYRTYAAWREEERNQGISCSPDFFKMSQMLTTPLPGLDPATPFWLSTWQWRREWQETLQSRIDQQNTVIEAIQNVVRSVEEATLPALRDALAQASDAIGNNPDELAKWITERLLIDAKSGGCQVTTRVAQAIETLQTFIFTLRSGQFKFLATFPLSLVSASFDEEWKWIGTYATWRAAMFVYLYCENTVHPALLKYQTPAFSALIRNTRAIRPDPGTACKEAQAYADYFKDICSLQIEATCQASTHIYSGTGCNRQYDTAQSMFYMFGRATSGKIYWSAYDAGGASGGYGQTFWKEIPGFTHTEVTRIIGAIPYRRRVRSTSAFAYAEVEFAEVLSSYIYLFCIVSQANKQILKLARLQLDDFGVWDDTVTDLPVPPLNLSAAEIVPVQSQSEYYHPALVFHEPDYYKMYYIHLNSEGNGWEQSNVNWPSYLYQFQYFGAITPANYPVKIKAVLRANNNMLWIATNESDGPHLSLITLKPGGAPSVSRAWYYEKGVFLGVLPGPLNDSPLAIPMFGWQESTVYFFWRDTTGIHYRKFTDGNMSINAMHNTISDLTEIPPHSGEGTAGEQMFAYKRDRNAQAWYMYPYAESGDQLTGSVTYRAVPRVQAPLNIPRYLSDAQLQQRRQEIINAFALNADATSSVLSYLHEAYFFVPLHLAMSLQTAGHYLAALDWFRTIYDYQAPAGPPNQRNIYYGLVLDAQLPDMPVYQLTEDWLLDPLNPHLIAATRRYAYTRFTIMSLVRCLLDYADAEFTQETKESLARARTLYLTSLDLLNLPELQQRLNVCDDLIAELKIEPGKDIPPEVPAIVGEIREELTKKASGFPFLEDIVTDITTILQTDASWTTKLIEAKAVVKEAVIKAPVAPAAGAIITAKSEALVKQYTTLLTQPKIDFILQDVSKAAVTKFVNGVGQPSGIMDPGSGVKKILNLQPAVISPSLQFCIPPNPMLKLLRLHAELNLGKLRSCRNIAGIKRELDAYAAPTDTSTGMPVVGVDGQLFLPGVNVIKPTLYRYSTLIERAKQLVQLAGQLENSMLLALERKDQAAYDLLKARQELNLAQKGVQLQNLRISEAQNEVKLATLQKERAQIQLNHYQTLLNQPISDLENEALKSLKEAVDFQNSAAGHFMESAADPSTYSLSAGYLGGSFGINFKDSDAAKGAWQAALASLSSMTAQRLSTLASYERRQQEWEFQEALSSQDIAIGSQQITLAHDHVQIITQEKVIAELQTSNAKDTVEFLTTKFTNVHLYDWMSGILESVYRFFLQQATAMAKLAQSQLAFERQEVAPAYIQADYWVVTADGTVTGNTNEKPVDRKGLTGSARLLQDIYQLDQHAFSTNRRKLQLVKTFSLALLAPLEFQRFRQNGILHFATPMELFDRSFPGQYLRLIKRVKTSVIALIPPPQGIHATLGNPGLSRVVIGPDIFQTIPIRRDPELIALSTPMNATGLFELEAQQTDMLFPFEGNGVDTTWEFRMPKAANLFDYRTIADVLITIEYTALHSFDYEQQVKQMLNPRLSADQTFSFLNKFADQWFDLHNPDQTKKPMSVRFQTFHADFPPNMDHLTIQQVLLYFVAEPAIQQQLPLTELKLTGQESIGSTGGTGMPIDGVISTRRGNGSSWTSMLGKSPVGTWELTLPDTEEVRNRFKNEEIEDILFVITYAGRTPAWPDY